MKPGPVLLSIRQRFGHGLRVAYYRDVVRPQILKTPPVVTEVSGDVEVCVLTGHADVLNLLWAIKSFYRTAGGAWPLLVLDDGTLTCGDFDLLAGQFPAGRVLSAKHVEEKARELLREFPQCRRYREQHPLARKCFDAGMFMHGRRMLLLDTDLLFFRRPEALLKRMRDPQSLNYFNADLQPALNITSHEAKRRFDIDLIDRINTGLCLLHREVFSLEWMEEFLTCDSIWSGHPWRIEQTLLALAASRSGAALLPADQYRISLDAGINGCVARHYVGAVRHLMYREGMSYLSHAGFLRKVSVESGACA